MLRASLLRLADEEHVLLLALHHIATDGWSIRVLWRELEVAYGASLRRQDPALPWLPRRIKRLIDAFETVMACRWPTIQDSRLSRWARAALKGLSWWRYALNFYKWPRELEVAQMVLQPRDPRVESL